MKAIILSVQPQWLEMILNGKKTIEIRKSKPKCSLPIDVYLYCTQAKPLLLRLMNYGWALSTNIPSGYVVDKKNPNAFNGRVVAKFTLNWCHKLNYNYVFDEYGSPYEEDMFLQDACLTQREILAYGNASVSRPGIKPLYAWHIDNLVIFDTPKELKKFEYPFNAKNYRWDNKRGRCYDVPLDKAPQSWQFIEVAK